MNTIEASRLLTKWLAGFRAEPYDSLVSRVGRDPVGATVPGAAGTYQVEAQCFWDAEAGGNVRVVASIDDGGIRAFAPLTDDFIKSPNGAFVGE